MVGKAHMTAGVSDGNVRVGAVEAEHVEANVLLLQKIKHVLKEKACIVRVKQGSLPLDEVEQRVSYGTLLHVARGKSGNAVGPERNAFKGADGGDFNVGERT